MNLEYRTATLAGVSFPARTIELIVTPYESEATVEHRGRMIREIFSRGAFGKIDAGRHRVNVNRDHDLKRVVGKAVAFHPDRQEGLVAELRIAPTPLGDETLQLADEEILDASAGFAVEPGGERWEDGARRRITKAWLGHIAMTPDPAYREARVLAVRTAAETPVVPQDRLATPNLDRIRLWRQQAGYAAIVTRR